MTNLTMTCSSISTEGDKVKVVLVSVQTVTTSSNTLPGFPSPTAAYSFSFLVDTANADQFVVGKQYPVTVGDAIVAQ